MSDLFYKTLRLLGSPAFIVSSTPVVIGSDHVPRSGPCLLAANHSSPYDVPLIMRHCPRHVDFLSITEVFANPFVAWLYGSMNAFPLDRSRPDARAVRTIVSRLRAGRAVAMFPEGGFRRGEHSMLRTGRIKPGLGRIALLSEAPIIPCLILNSVAYSNPAAWAPLRRTRYAVAFGKPIDPAGDPRDLEREFVRSIAALHVEVAPSLPVAGRWP